MAAFGCGVDMRGWPGVGAVAELSSEERLAMCGQSTFEGLALVGFVAAALMLGPMAYRWGEQAAKKGAMGG